MGQSGPGHASIEPVPGSLLHARLARRMRWLCRHRDLHRARHLLLCLDRRAFALQNYGAYKVLCLDRPINVLQTVLFLRIVLLIFVLYIFSFKNSRLCP